VQIILNADDFGASSSINAAIRQAHQEGVLTSTSLMVAGKAVTEAIALARGMPDLAVGLHLVVVGGRSVLPPDEIPHLVNRYGEFARDALRAGLIYFFNSATRRELALELQAQFARFAESGLPLSHVDGHQHMHLHPTVFSLLLPLLDQYNVSGLRLPRDELWLSLRYDRHRAALKTCWALVFGILDRWCLRQLWGRSLVIPDRVYGFMQSGQMQEAYVLKLLQELHVPTAELYFHPDTAVKPNPLIQTIWRPCLAPGYAR
jgi:hopanoid biosynthesis associated protein HpnK